MEFALPKDAFKGGHCGVQAVAVVAGISLNDAFIQFKKHCKFIAKRKRWSGGTHYEDRLVVLDKLNVKYDKLVRKQKTGNNKVDKIGYGMTLQRFIKDVANPNHVYMVTTTGHVQLVYGNNVLDQGGVVDINDYWGKRKKISHTVLVFKQIDAAKAFDIAEAQTFGLPLFDMQGGK
tara:strand:- start:151 stop:678 length:528 start_codon:yes stop_codon:yes gene_type:complete